MSSTNLLTERWGTMDQQLPLGLSFSSAVKALPPVRKRVTAGAEFLDVWCPADWDPWETLIDVKILDMSCPNNSILGQLFDNYSNGLRKLGLTPYRGVELGFSIIDPEGPSAIYEYGILTKCCREFLKRRLKAVSKQRSRV